MSTSNFKITFSFCFLLFGFFAKGQVVSNFSANDESWTVFNGNTGATTAPTYNNTGGNPTGNISFSTSAGNANIYFVAPAKFIGDLSGSYNKNFSFDLNVSTAGTDNTSGDVIITGGGVNLFYQLPTKPSVGVWTNYVIPLNESQWKNGCPTCAAPNQTTMKLALSNVTKIQIRLKYLTGNTATYTGQLDNVTLNTPTLISPPTITSFVPKAALPGSSVTITGTNFNTTPSQNAVYFNGTKANVTNATATQLIVTVPASAGYGLISAENLSTGLSGYTLQSFNPLFDNNKDFGGRIIPASMSRGYYNILKTGSESSNSFGGLDKGDLDGDGWIDLVVTETSNASIVAYRNLATGGSVSTSSFAAGQVLPSLSSVPGGSPGLSEVLVVDVDNDGKLDVAASTSGNLSTGTGFLAVYRNTSTPGTISFANPVFFAYNYYASLAMAAGDLDADGRVDFAFTTGTSPGNIFINHNLSTPGNIDFAFGVNIGPTSTSGLSDIVIADLTNDGKPEIICPGYNAATISIYPNNSTLGTISMGSAFTIPAVVSYTNQVVVTDLDADGKLDMAWSTYGAQFVYMTKNIYAGGAFDASAFGSTIQIASTLSNPQGIAAADVNGDGKPEIVLSGYSDIGIMQNVGSGSLSANSFSSPVVMQGSQASQAIAATVPAIADFDGDNKPDVAITYRNNAITASDKGTFIFHNECFPVPSINSVSPTSANVGTTVALAGSLMFTGNSNPTVSLSKISATLSGVPTNSLTSIISPLGSMSGKFWISNHGLASKGPNFNLTFNTNRSITVSSFGPSIDFALANGTVYDNLESADFDNDGKMDFVFRDANGTGIFQNTSTAGQSISATSLTKQATTYSGGVNSFLFDFDGDGKTDIANAFQLFQSTTSGSAISFSAGTTTNANSFVGSAYGDFNKDGKIDVALLANSTNAVRIQENLSTRGAFTFGNFSTFSNTGVNLTLPGNNTGNNGVVVEDFDGDGYDDVIATITSTNQFSVYINKAVNGTISGSSFALNGNITTSGSQPKAITAADFDGDGKIDLAISFLNQTYVSVYKNTSTTGTISFNSPVNLTSGTKAYAMTSQDLDGDGKAEIIVAHQLAIGVGGSVTIFQNTSAAGVVSFGTGINFSISRTPQALITADVNSDQKPDILILATGGAAAPANAVMVFENKILAASITISTQPSNSTTCNGTVSQFNTAASGTTNIVYQWQFASVAAGPFNNISNTGGYTGATTASLSVNTTGNFGAGFYRCKVDGDFAATVFTNNASLTINPLPATPSVTGASGCPNTLITLNASGGTNGQYRWYAVATGGTAIAGQTNSSYSISTLTSTTTYYVAINNGTCEGNRAAVVATVNACNPPSITAQVLTTPAGGTIVLDLTKQITSANLDLTSLKVITLPPNANSASIDAKGLLTVDYTGKNFVGTEKITIRACDINGQCTQQDFEIDVVSDVVVYNALSPGGANPTFVIQFIDQMPETKSNTVTIFDRWENQVWKGTNYDNSSVVFKGVGDSGNDLPSGTYFYRIDFASGKKSKTGFISMKR